jgi:allophanate hydrolase
MRDLTLGALHSAYASGRVTVQTVVADALQRITSGPAGVWIHVLSERELRPYLRALARKGADALPLYGVPFAIKDNIDLAGAPTTAGCPEFSYRPKTHAPVVAALIEAGAIPIGKTNLDQFATGLVGVRSPYGACPNAYDARYISGGSSSGSAVAVALDQVGFALGTDTAGSGRIPAAFNNLIGLKPTRGVVSARGVVPACRSLDCVSLFTKNVSDASLIFRSMRRFDPADAFARPAPAFVRPGAGGTFSFATPRPGQVRLADAESRQLWKRAVARLAACGGRQITIDFSPFIEAARLLYDGPYVAERYAAVGAFIERRPAVVLPVTREIILQGALPRAVDAFRARYKLAELQRRVAEIFAGVDVLLTPTAPAHYTIDAVNRDPLRLNSELGYYTNFMNLLDLAAIAVPAGFNGRALPWGVTLSAPAGADDFLLELAARFESGTAAAAELAPRAAGRYEIVVCGAHMRGMPLNRLLTERGAIFLEPTRTARAYRLYALAGGAVQRPGLVRVESGGESVAAELWSLPARAWGEFVNEIPAPLAIGGVELEDGRVIKGFVCEAYAARAADALDITALGGWRAYMKRRPTQRP